MSARPPRLGLYFDSFSLRSPLHSPLHSPPGLGRGKEFEGAGLTFCGTRGGGAERSFTYRHKHVKGQAIMHVGHHRHGADDIVSGERYNLILWNKCSIYRASRDYLGRVGQPGGEPPDLVCLSYTHDSDYEQYKPYPPGKRPKREAGG